MMKISRSALGAELITIYGNQCFYCQVEFTRELPLTIDHFYPQSVAKQEGWTTEQIWDINNLRPACKSCNVRKGDIIPNADGSVVIPVRRERALRGPRPELRECCDSGRLIWPGDVCGTCGTGAMPESAPRAIQAKTAAACDHDFQHCWSCMLGHTPRKSVMWWLMTGESE